MDEDEWPISIGSAAAFDAWQKLGEVLRNDGWKYLPDEDRWVRGELKLNIEIYEWTKLS